MARCQGDRAGGGEGKRLPTSDLRLPTPPDTLSPRHPVTLGVAVIGAGIIGAAIAHRLAEQGAAVVLLDRAEPGSGVTAASYAWINANEKLPRAYFDLNRAAMEEYRRLAWRLAPAPWYHADGNLIWFRDPAASAALAERVRRLCSWGYAAEILPASEVQTSLELGLQFPDARTPVAWFPEEAWVDAPAMTRRLADAVRNVGGRVLVGPDREIVAIGQDNSRVTTITLAGGQTIPVAAVVNAAGPNADHVAALVGRSLPLRPRPGALIRAEMSDGSDPLRRPVETDDIAIRPDGPGRLALTPGDDDAPARAGLPLGPLPLTHPLVRETMAAGAALVPALVDARPVSAVVAARPIPADGLPSVGSVPRIPGYWEAVTHSGVTLAPLIARSLADEILGKLGNPLLAPFRPERFAGN